MAVNADKRRRAEEFADYVEAEFRKLGVVGDFFCAQQRVRWREHAVRAYEGTAAEQEENSSASEAASS